MLPPMITGWPVSDSGAGSLPCPGRTRASRLCGGRGVSFLLPSIDMAFQLGGVVGDVIDHVHAELLGRAAEDLREDLADAVQDDLAVGKRHVDPHFIAAK